VGSGAATPATEHFHDPAAFELDHVWMGARVLAKVAGACAKSSHGPGTDDSRGQDSEDQQARENEGLTLKETSRSKICAQSRHGSDRFLDCNAPSRGQRFHVRPSASAAVATGSSMIVFDRSCQTSVGMTRTTIRARGGARGPRTT